MSGRNTGEVTALQAALAAEHAAVYGYGVVGGRIREERRTEARAAYDAHRARRDALAREVRGLGAEPIAASAAYALPFAVPDSAAALRLAVELEERVAGVYSDLVRAATGARRREAAGALREAAVRAARWRGGSVAFPGLAERTGAETEPAATGAGAAATRAGSATPAPTSTPTTTPTPSA
ncbi:ferritin-like domain-containing protein [Streptomyces sp. NPDC088766]|uniref:ferritin-like domain-containing protein n=1 Tax=Streptomyces sp. NPDC088766 TaxID=3365893 RepID=UPI0038051647